ncbi:MAG: hypothetical protein KAT58_12510 [candidate division Zixibacteria bacterium]|nr:hypothetical protein [candidate division Zixibacteria bacterium]
MKKVKFLGVLVSLTLILVACGGANGAANTATTALNEDYPDALPIQTQLTLGILKLEETDLAVDTEQAAELLTLWQAIRSLSSSDITAEGEIEAIVNQILDTMSSEQLEAIAAMELTQEGILELTQELGIARGGDWTGEGDPRSSAPDGMVPGSGPGGGLGGGMGGGRFSEGEGNLDLDPEQIATLQAERAEKRSSGDQFTMFLINPLIQLLESRSQS